MYISVFHVILMKYTCKFVVKSIQLLTPLKQRSNKLNPISVGPIFDNFLWGGGHQMPTPPPLKSALIELEKF